MATANFLYRDTLYAQSTYIHPNDCECHCDAKAISVGCEHESDCPVIQGYYDEWLYDDTKDNIIAHLEKIRTEKRYSGCTLYGDKDLGWTNDNRNFDGAIVGRMYKDLTYCLGLDNTGEIDVSIGDDFCLRPGYYEGFNFDRLTSQYATFGTDEFDNIKDDVWERIFKYDELCLQEFIDDRQDEVVNGVFSNLDEAFQAYGADKAFTFDEKCQECFDEIMAIVDKFIADANSVFDEIGKCYFNQYACVARASNGEAFYQEIA
ncbi:hypothetical protein LP092_15000 (plasmid) [Moraxella bovis]|uniref:Uncharacterized protein n=1 Tax=Moraxella bovis TaxID=476 RepID=A0ABY6MEW0_MORBO|nr:hypothetical protein [Moraxella bovis]UZA04784.1 hypothetical protein LP092_15000 [Moraxella bovis]